MGVYENNIVPIKIVHLAEHVSKMKRISLDEALVYIYINPMYKRLYDEQMRLCHDSTVVVRKPSLFRNGVLDAQAAILQLRAYKTYDQLSFHTEKVIKTLKFIETIDA